MPAVKETVKTTILVTPEWDRKAVSKLEKDFGKVQKRLSSMKMDWTQLSKSSKTAVADVKKISDAAAMFSKELSSAAKSSLKDFAALGKQLAETKKKAEELRKKAATAGSPAEQKAVNAEVAETEKQMADLNRQIRDHRKVDKQYVSELKGVVKAQRDAKKKYQDDLKRAAAYTGKDFRRDFMGSLKRAASGPRGALGGVGGAVRAGSKYSSGVSARSAMSGGTGIAAGFSKLVPILAGATTGLAAFIGFIAKASASITSMNKALLEGTGYANDFTSKSGAYTDAIDELRRATKDASLSLIVMGGNTEMTAKIVNKYMAEASGSVIKTRDAMLALGKGDAKRGVEVLAKNAIAYGKALGIEAGDVAEMVGKMENEIGYGAAQTQNIMGDIVKAAATSNMPVSKFMDIFRQTTPNLELFTNRMEELTGVIKMLSKNMSPRDVKKFMDSFSKGFQGQGFTERVHHVLLAGQDKTNKILQGGFVKKAEVLGQSLNQFGDNMGDEFVNAFKKGDKQKMQNILNVAKSRGAQGATIGEAQKLMGVEDARKRGGPLGLASALKGASMRDMSKMMQAEVARVSGERPDKRIDEVRELVAESFGWSQDQIDALNQFNDNIGLYQNSLQTYGTTVSRSMDSALKGILARRMGKAEDQITPEDMAKASQDEIEMAAELSNKDEKRQQTAMDLARENADATVSLGEKLENVIGYILEQIYEKVSGVLKVLNDIFNSIIDWFSGETGKTKLKAGIDRYSVKGYGQAETKQFGELKDALKEGVDQGKSGMGLAHTAGDFYGKKYGQMQEEMYSARKRARDAKSPEEKAAAEKDAKAAEENVSGMTESFKAAIDKMLTGRGMGGVQKDNIMKGVGEALKRGDFGKALETVAAYGGEGDVNSLLKFGQTVLPKAIAEADRKTEKGGPLRRSGTKEKAINEFQRDKEVAKEISDTVEIDPSKTLKGAAASQLGKEAAKIVKTKQVAAAAAAGAAKASPGDSPSSATSSSDDAKKLKDVLKPTDSVRAQEDASDSQVKATEDVYEGIHDVAGILKKGIRFETSFLTGAYTNAIKVATLDSFRDALIEFAVIQAKMQRSPGFAGFMSDYSQDFVNMAPGAAMGLLTGEAGKGTASDPNSVQKRFSNEREKMGSMLSGGPIPDTGMYRLHRGEYVVPSVPADSSRSQSRGGSQVNATVIINGTGLTQQQLEGAVYGALHKVANRP